MTDILEQLAEALGPIMEQQKGRKMGLAFKHDTGGTNPSGLQYSHGPGGLLTFPGVDPVVFSTIMGADSIIGMIPTMPSLFTNPTFYTITGVRADVGDEKDGVCDNAPTGGLMKACLTTSVFGRYERATPLLEINRLGQRTDRADPIDLRLVNTPLANGGPFMGAADVSMNPADLLTNEVTRKFWERNVSLHRLLAHQLWTGNPANNSAGGGYKEMTGLQLLVNTGYVDIETGQRCQAVDSLVRSFNHARVDGDVANTIRVFANTYRQLKERARRSGVAPVRWVIAMRESLFYELTAIWPCSYLSFRCITGNASAVEQIDAQDAVRFRDEMRAGKYLLIDGERVEVVHDDGIPEAGCDDDGLVPCGCFGSDVYFLPMSIVGGQQVLFMEYFQYQNPSITDAMGQMILGRIEGPWITWPRQTNLCVEWQSKIEPRLILRTPWLAARINDVVWCPDTEGQRDPFPEDPYFVNGGRTSRPGPSYYQLWNSSYLTA